MSNTTDKQLNELAPGHYEICDDSRKGVTRQKVRVKDQPKPGWVVAQQMHTDNVSRIDRARKQREDRRTARMERRAS